MLWKGHVDSELAVGLIALYLKNFAIYKKTVISFESYLARIFLVLTLMKYN